MQTIGQICKAAREAKGASVSEAAAATRMKSLHVDAIERDDFARLGVPIYAKGFIRIYAEYLGLDSVPLVQAYAAHYAPGDRPPIAPKTTSKLLNNRKAPSSALAPAISEAPAGGIAPEGMTDAPGPSARDIATAAAAARLPRSVRTVSTVLPTSAFPPSPAPAVRTPPKPVAEPRRAPAPAPAREPLTLIATPPPPKPVAPPEPPPPPPRPVDDAQPEFRFDAPIRPVAPPAAAPITAPMVEPEPDEEPPAEPDLFHPPPREFPSDRGMRRSVDPAALRRGLVLTGGAAAAVLLIFGIVEGIRALPRPAPDTAAPILSDALKSVVIEEPPAPYLDPRSLPAPGAHRP